MYFGQLLYAQFIISIFPTAREGTVTETDVETGSVCDIHANKPRNRRVVKVFYRSFHRSSFHLFRERETVLSRENAEVKRINRKASSGRVETAAVIHADRERRRG